MVKTKNPIAMQSADKEDAVLVAVSRDGKTYLGSQIKPSSAEDQGLATNKLIRRAISKPMLARSSTKSRT
jgi:hypothetical protein